MGVISPHMGLAREIPQNTVFMNVRSILPRFKIK
jgi:hypothetical protein